ncbi:uncharacterized protein FIBRA_06671 [Fibroporia radiculosa]|uniref:Uncharacterized protein n=1 Tax=Fibroporia radiculosa TaxID=599839 RepID=J4IBD9_9APHY|nr:uncharacterized protein FIBRA_06671 [Fibroporia radiculosa]CCM04491.1 predicted protein [Fibroporia radiculosa]
MLIYLLPAEPHPRLYHAVNFSDPYERVALPTGWAAQLHSIHADELDPPTAIHALDKSSWLTAVIEELVFDLVSLTVSCSFVNGPTIQWPMDTDDACMHMLADVLADLAQSKVESDRERLTVSPKEEPAALPQPVSVKPAKHKKQRSILSSLISSFNKLSLSSSHDGMPSSVSPSRPSFLPPPSPRFRPSTISWKPTVAFLPPSKKMPLPAAPSRPLSALLQARARSALVDAFRQFVVPVLRGRFDLRPGGYSTWAARVMLRRTEDHMAWLVQESGGVVPNIMDTMPPFSRNATSSGLSGSTLTSITDASFYVDDDLEGGGDQQSLTDSASTETDGSSVHTPVDSPSTPFGHISRSNTDTHRSAQSVPRSPSPPEFSPEDLATYTSLSSQCVRLRHMLSRMEATRMDAEQDERSYLAVLEVKSRRRAWSNRDYLGGAGMDGMGLALPFRSSPLARCDSVTPDCLINHLEVTTGDHNISTLFPVSEEDEEDEEASIGLVPDAALCDLESGLLPPLQRPSMRPRTRSMRALHALEADMTFSMDAPTLMIPSPSPLLRKPTPMSAAQSLPPSALLFQPLKKPMLESQTKFELFDTMEHDDEDAAAPEFTLSMDLPPPYARIGDHGQDGWIGVHGVVR